MRAAIAVAMFSLVIAGTASAAPQPPFARAGGFVTDFRGADRAIERSEFLAANDALHSKLHKLVAGALR